MFSVGLKRQKFGKDCDLLEKQQTILIVALAAIPQDPEAKVDDLLDQHRIDIYILLIIQQFSTESLYDLDRPLDLEDILMVIADVSL